MPAQGTVFVSKEVLSAMPKYAADHQAVGYNFAVKDPVEMWAWRLKTTLQLDALPDDVRIESFDRTLHLENELIDGQFVVLLKQAPNLPAKFAESIAYWDNKEIARPYVDSSKWFQAEGYQCYLIEEDDGKAQKHLGSDPSREQLLEYIKQTESKEWLEDVLEEQYGQSIVFEPQAEMLCEGLLISIVGAKQFASNFSADTFIKFVVDGVDEFDPEQEAVKGTFYLKVEDILNAPEDTLQINLAGICLEDYGYFY